MIKITTHILDVSLGCPAAEVEIVLYRGNDPAVQADNWQEIARERTNADGRITGWSGDPGMYKIRFDTKTYFTRQGVTTFYPFVEVHFELTGGDHYHIPLLLSPWGYSTYRGS